MFGLEWWFIFAVLSAVIGGIGNFGNKISAQRNYNSAVIMTLSALIQGLIFLPFALVYENISLLPLSFVAIVLLAGFIVSFSAVIKIQVLHYIDSAIFLPLYKVFSPLVVIVFGILFFAESFTPWEWFGLTLSLLVPFLLISRIEHTRQNNLKLGLLLILIAGVIGAIAAGIQKYATDISDATLSIMVISSTGILLGSMLQLVSLNGRNAVQVFNNHLHRGPLLVSLLRSTFAGTGFYLTLLAYEFGGSLGIVYTINSLYILLPIILAVIFYNEHWNLRKAIAIILSVVALALLQ